jgi:hypothetical protein
MSNVRGVPAQDRPENQDASVQYSYDEVTKQTRRWQREEPAQVEKQPKRRGRPPKQREEDSGDAGSSEGEGE